MSKESDAKTELGAVDTKHAALVKDVEDKKAALDAAQAKLDAAAPELNPTHIIAVLVARAGGAVAISRDDLVVGKGRRLGVTTDEVGNVTLEVT